MNIYEKFEYLESKGYKYQEEGICCFRGPDLFGHNADGTAIYSANNLESVINELYSLVKSGE